MLVLFGCGGHGRSVADVLLSNHKNCSFGEDFCFVDENGRPGEEIFSRPVHRTCPIGEFEAFLAIGDNAERRHFYEMHRDLQYVRIISDDAYIGYAAQVGWGTFVAHHAHIGPDCAVGIQSIVNTGAVVDHECHIGDFCHLAPHSTISGRSVLGDNVFLGAGATVIDKVHIVDDVVIGAGATVVRDLTEPGVYVGTPARQIRGASGS